MRIFDTYLEKVLTYIQDNPLIRGLAYGINGTEDFMRYYHEFVEKHNDEFTLDTFNKISVSPTSSYRSYINLTWVVNTDETPSNGVPNLFTQHTRNIYESITGEKVSTFTQFVGYHKTVVDTIRNEVVELIRVDALLHNDFSFFCVLTSYGPAGFVDTRPSTLITEDACGRVIDCDTLEDVFALARNPQVYVPNTNPNDIRWIFRTLAIEPVLHVDVPYSATSMLNDDNVLFIADSHYERRGIPDNTILRVALSVEQLDADNLRVNGYWDDLTKRWMHRMTNRLDRILPMLRTYDNTIEDDHAYIYQLTRTVTDHCENCSRETYQNNYFGPFDAHRYQTLNGSTFCPKCYARETAKLTVLKGSNYRGLFVPEGIAKEGYDDKFTRNILTGINSYDFSPEEFKFIFTEKDRAVRPRLYLGTEIEMDGGEANDTDANVIMATLSGVRPLCYTMHDGSLHSGFEIGTMPATLDAHMNVFNYTDAFKTAIALGYRAHDTTTCGLHVHINRKFFSETDSREQRYRGALMELFFERNWAELTRFSRRTSDKINYWSAICDMKSHLNRGSSYTRVVEVFSDECEDNEKYRALNTMHSRTFELRMFRGTLRRETYLATLQFVSNLAHFIKEATLDQVYDATVDSIAHYQSYPELEAYMKSRNPIYESGGLATARHDDDDDDDCEYNDAEQNLVTYATTYEGREEIPSMAQ